LQEEERPFGSIFRLAIELHRTACPRGNWDRALAMVGLLGTRSPDDEQDSQLARSVDGLSFRVGAISQAHGKVAHALKAPVAEAASSLCKAATP